MRQFRYLTSLPALCLAAGALLLGCNGSKPAPPPVAAASGPQVYAKNCQGCHGPKGEGVKGVGTPLRKLTIRIPDDQILHIIRTGRGKMPAYKELSDAEVNAVIAYIKGF